MATSHGSNRDTGSSQMTVITDMTEEEYKYLVNLIVDHREQYILLMETCGEVKRHRTWLHLLGLLETWNMVE